MKILVMGIHGALAQHIAAKLLVQGHEVVGLGRSHEKLPLNLSKVKLFKFDFSDLNFLQETLENIDVVVHLAAQTGFKDNISDYITSNLLTTSRLLDAIFVNGLKINKLIYASSSAIYGEGAYKCLKHGLTYPPMRSIEQIKDNFWELICPICSEKMETVGTSEEKVPNNSHAYGLTKLFGEKLINGFSENYGLQSINLRFSIMYGPMQNKGIIPIFSNKIFENQEVIVNEDGQQVRDFLYIEDAADALLFAMKHIEGSGTYNVSSGKGVDLSTLIDELGNKANIVPKFKTTALYRKGDVRHIYLDNSKLGKLGFTPKISLGDGIQRYFKWLQKE